MDVQEVEDQAVAAASSGAVEEAAVPHAQQHRHQDLLQPKDQRSLHHSNHLVWASEVVAS